MDLKPYVCIAEQCAGKSIFFTSFGSWRRHMDDSHSRHWPQEIHKPKVWFCDINDGEYLEFETSEHFREHLLKHHSPASFTDAQMASKMRWNVLSLPRKRNTCPLCNEDIIKLNVVGSSTKIKATDGANMETKKCRKKGRVVFAVSDDDNKSDDNEEKVHMASEDDAAETANEAKFSRHIGDHLKSLAFLSVRYLDEEPEDEDTHPHSKQSQKAANGMMPECQELDDQEDEFGPLSPFEDIPEDERPTPASETYESDSSILSSHASSPTSTQATQRLPQLPCRSFDLVRNIDFRDSTLEVLKLIDGEVLSATSSLGRQRTQAENLAASTRAFLIWGDHGMGKTEIAVEYMHSRINRFDAILWVNSSTVQELNEGFRKFAVNLGLIRTDDVRGIEDESVRTMVHEWLAKPDGQFQTDPARAYRQIHWLIVFDNVVDETLLSDFWPRPRSPQSSRLGAVILTCRHRLRKSSLPGLTSGIHLKYRLNEPSTLTQGDLGGYMMDYQVYNLLESY